MQIPLVNSVASWFLKKRFHQIDLFLKYPYDVQNELLVNLLEGAKNTELGLKYDFKSIESYREFANRVPVSTYEMYEELIDRSLKGEQNIFFQLKTDSYVVLSRDSEYMSQSGQFGR